MGATIGDDPTHKAMRRTGSEDHIYLPPGFRFYPTDEEIITHYLFPKLTDCTFIARAIGEVDLNKSEPWDLPSKAKMGEKEFYFFCQRDRKYPTGMRTNRATESGYWKATGKDKEIYKDKDILVGMKKTLVFYKGRAPKGIKTNWVMHEYRIEGKTTYWKLPKSTKDDWVVSRIFHKTAGIKRGLLSDQALSTSSIQGEGSNVDHTSVEQSKLMPSQYINTSYGPNMGMPQNQFIINNQMLINPYSTVSSPSLFYSQPPIPMVQTFNNSQNRSSIGYGASTEPAMSMQCKMEGYVDQSQMGIPSLGDMDIKNNLMWSYKNQ